MAHPSLPRARRLPSAACALVGLLAATTTALTSGPSLAAVAAYDAGVVTVPGVRVVASFDGVGAALVEGDAASLARLARADGVRGLSPDVAVRTSGHGSGGAGAVYAAAGLGGQAGKQHAGRGVRVAVVDTGVSDTVALDRASGRLVDAVDTSTVGEPGGGVVTSGRFVDGYGHGTFMASVVAGGRVDGHYLGVAPGATVLNVRVARPDGSSSLSKVLAGLDWVADHSDEVDVVNLSLSKERPFEAYGADPLTHAVEVVRAAGVTVVVASGNDASVVSDPGFTPQALTVGAADLTDGRASVAEFSGSGIVAGVRKPDVVASGVGVLGVLPAGSVIAAASPPARTDGLSKGSGTSQATAVVSGLAALLLERHPGATPLQVKSSLRSAADDLAGAPLGPADGDLTGEAAFDASTWGASSWGAGTWGAGTWGASSWGASSWAAGTWAAGTWGAGTWAGRFEAAP